MHPSLIGSAQRSGMQFFYTLQNVLSTATDNHASAVRKQNLLKNTVVPWGKQNSRDTFHVSPHTPVNVAARGGEKKRPQDQ